MERADHSKQLNRMRGRINQYERLMREEKITNGFIALEVIMLLYDARESGISDQELSEIWPHAWGDQGIFLPFVLVTEIVQGWHRYRDDYSSMSLEEALKVQKPGKGRKPIKSKMDTIDRETKRSNRVIREYILARQKGDSISFEEAARRAAHILNTPYDTIWAAWKKNRRILISILKQEGVL